MWSKKTGQEQDMRTKDIMNLRLLVWKVSHGIEKLIRRTKMEYPAERKKEFLRQ